MFLAAREVRLGPEQRAVLEARLRAPTTEQRDVLRARIALRVAEGLASRAIARELGIMPRTASLRRIRFAEAGWTGLPTRRAWTAARHNPKCGIMPPMPMSA